VNAYLRMLIAVVVLSVAAFADPIPGPGTDQIFLFASPNARESLTDEDAKARLASFEQINATAVADRAACALTHQVQIADTLGIYDKSSENSFILEADLNQDQSEYLAALLALYSRQEFVLLFFDEAGGPDRLWIIKTQQPIKVVITILRKLNLTPVTVRTGKDHNEVWFVDLGEKRAEDLTTFASNVNGQSSLTAGVAEMLGNQARASAVNGWRAQIRAFEQRSGAHLSGQLSSKGWRGATAAHTCSREMSLP
jgi:hypothetical protein